MVLTVILNIVLTKPLLVSGHLSFGHTISHSIGMNSRATYFKFVYPRMSHYTCY